MTWDILYVFPITALAMIVVLSALPRRYRRSRSRHHKRSSLALIIKWAVFALLAGFVVTYYYPPHESLRVLQASMLAAACMVPVLTYLAISSLFALFSPNTNKASNQSAINTEHSTVRRSRKPSPSVAEDHLEESEQFQALDQNPEQTSDPYTKRNKEPEELNSNRHQTIAASQRIPQTPVNKEQQASGTRLNNTRFQTQALHATQPVEDEFLDFSVETSASANDFTSELPSQTVSFDETLDVDSFRHEAMADNVIPRDNVSTSAHSAKNPHRSRHEASIGTTPERPDSSITADSLDQTMALEESWMAADGGLHDESSAARQDDRYDDDYAQQYDDTLVDEETLKGQLNRVSSMVENYDLGRQAKLATLHERRREDTFRDAASEVDTETADGANPAYIQQMVEIDATSNKALSKDQVKTLKKTISALQKDKRKLQRLVIAQQAAFDSERLSHERSRTVAKEAVKVMRDAREGQRMALKVARRERTERKRLELKYEKVSQALENAKSTLENQKKRKKTKKKEAALGGAPGF